MDDTNYRDLQPGDERAYDAMAQVVKANVSQSLIPFQAAANVQALWKIMRAEDFFQEFFDHTNQFIELCCHECAKIMRQCAQVPEVRGTPTVSLAGEIRREVFKSVDDSIEGLKQSKARIDNFATKLRQGEIAPSTEGLLLLRQADDVMPKVIGEHLTNVKALTEPLLDYCCARCFGDAVSLDRQRHAVEGVRCAITRELEPVIQMVLALPEAKKRIEKERLAAGNTQELETQSQREQQEMEFRKRDPALATFLLVIAFGMAAWAFNSCDLDKSSEAGLTWGLFLYLGAFVALVLGIMKFFDRRPEAYLDANSGRYAPASGDKKNSTGGGSALRRKRPKAMNQGNAVALPKRAGMKERESK